VGMLAITSLSISGLNLVRSLSLVPQAPEPQEPKDWIEVLRKEDFAKD